MIDFPQYFSKCILLSYLNDINVLNYFSCIPFLEEKNTDLCSQFKVQGKLILDSNSYNDVINYLQWLKIKSK